MAAVWPVLLMALTIVVIVFAAPAFKSKNKLHQHQVTEHLLRIHEFRCKHPQPRLVPFTSLVETGQKTDLSYVPAATVLHRCDASTGCCFNRERSSCGPLNTTIVNLVFQEKNSVGSRTEFSYIEVQAVNHTLCGCLDVSAQDTPK